MNSNVHFFSPKSSIQGHDLVSKLGLRGRQANELAALGLPIVPGFIIVAPAAAHIEKEFILEIRPHINKIEKIIGKQLGNNKNPLLFKIVVSPNLAISSYPTLHNFGLSKNTVSGFAAWTSPCFAIQEMLFLIKGMLGIELKIATLEGRESAAKQIESAIQLCNNVANKQQGQKPDILLAQFASYLPEGFFASAEAQLILALRRVSKLIQLEEQDTQDTALLVQAMVYGNYGKFSSTGSFYTRNIISGEAKIQGEYCNASFDAKGGAKGIPIHKIHPQYLPEFKKMARKIEDKHREIRQIRFTIENKKLWLVDQKQVENKSAQADLRFSLELYQRKLISRADVVTSIAPGRLNEILHPLINNATGKKLPFSIGGISGAPGAAVGRAYFSTEKLIDSYHRALQQKEDTRTILVMPATFAEDVKAIEVAEAVVSSEGGFSAHASVVARQYGKVSMVIPGMKIKGNKAYIGNLVITEGDVISISAPFGGQSCIWQGKKDLIEPDLHTSGLLDYIQIAKKYCGSFSVRANADSGRDAAVALKLGAEGIGLCRTEHMFFNKKRINVFREMILSNSKEERLGALEKLLPMQRDDFVGIFKVMAGKHITIRLLDAPLHEFLPHSSSEMDSFAEYLTRQKNFSDLTKAQIQARSNALAEFNPMLGHRGCRIAVSYPEIYEMQLRAIIDALYALGAMQKDITLEIMVPIVMNPSELKLLVYGKKIEGNEYLGLLGFAEKYIKKNKIIDFKIGVMIELPAAALLAGEIARYCQFFSFGTNDLTQTSLGISRDDFNTFMPDYSLYDLIQGNPFSLLTEPVKELITIAVKRGRITRPGLHAGLCGEHGANPDNIDFCIKAGLDYVSCSPYQVPLAIAAVAQNKIKST